MCAEPLSLHDIESGVSSFFRDPPSTQVTAAFRLKFHDTEGELCTLQDATYSDAFSIFAADATSIHHPGPLSHQSSARPLGTPPTTPTGLPWLHAPSPCRLSPSDRPGPTTRYCFSSPSRRPQSMALRISRFLSVCLPPSPDQPFLTSAATIPREASTNFGPLITRWTLRPQAPAPSRLLEIPFFRVEIRRRRWCDTSDLQTLPLKNAGMLDQNEEGHLSPHRTRTHPPINWATAHCSDTNIPNESKVKPNQHGVIVGTSLKSRKIAHVSPST